MQLPFWLLSNERMSWESKWRTKLMRKWQVECHCQPKDPACQWPLLFGKTWEQSDKIRWLSGWTVQGNFHLISILTVVVPQVEAHRIERSWVWFQQRAGPFSQHFSLQSLSVSCVSLNRSLKEVQHNWFSTFEQNFKLSWVAWGEASLTWMELGKNSALENFISREILLYRVFEQAWRVAWPRPRPTWPRSSWPSSPSETSRLGKARSPSRSWKRWLDRSGPSRTWAKERCLGSSMKMKFWR